VRAWKVRALACGQEVPIALCTMGTYVLRAPHSSMYYGEHDVVGFVGEERGRERERERDNKFRVLARVDRQSSRLEWKVLASGPLARCQLKQF